MKDAFQSSPIKSISIIGSGELLNQFSNQFSSLETITLNEGITKIGSNVFIELSSLITLNIPSTVQIIEGGSIQRCYKVNIVISENNKNYKYHEDNHYITNYESNSLILYIEREGEETTFDLDNTITSLGTKSFYGNSHIEILTLSETFQAASDGAFSNIPNLKEIRYFGSVPFTSNDDLSSSNIKIRVTLAYDITAHPSIMNINVIQDLFSISYPCGVDFTSSYNIESITKLVVEGEGTVFGPISLNGATDAYNPNIQIGWEFSEIDFSKAPNIQSFADQAFKGCTSLISIQIPASVHIIPSECFSGCSKLSSITIANKNDLEGIQIINSNSFENCISISSFVVPSTFESVGNNAFLGCTSLTTLEIPVTTSFQSEKTTLKLLKETVPTIISNNAFDLSIIKTLIFYGNEELKLEINNEEFSSIETITLKEGITSIEENVFVDLTTLTTLNIPSTVESIAGGSIQKCYNVEPIISKENQHITYSEDCFYTIPNENNPKSLLTTISRKDKTTIEIPDGVERIEAKAFLGNEFVQTIILPETIQSIGDNTFKGCTQLTEIKYLGTKEIEMDGEELFDDPDKVVIKVLPQYEGKTLFGNEVQIDNSLAPPDGNPTNLPDGDPTTPPDENPKENGLNGGEIAAIVIAVLVVAAVVAFLVYFFVFRKEKSEEEKMESNTQEDQTDSNNQEEIL